MLLYSGSCGTPHISGKAASQWFRLESFTERVYDLLQEVQRYKMWQQHTTGHQNGPFLEHQRPQPPISGATSTQSLSDHNEENESKPCKGLSVSSRCGSTSQPCSPAFYSSPPLSSQQPRISRASMPPNAATIEQLIAKATARTMEGSTTRRSAASPFATQMAVTPSHRDAAATIECEERRIPVG